MTRFLPLFEVRVRHPYYANGRCADLRLQPDADGARALDNQRWVLKSLPDGIRVFASAPDERSVPLVSIAAGTRLRFELVLEQPAFPLFTELPAPAGALHYGNAALGAGGGALELRGGPWPRQLPSFGSVTIENIAAAWLERAPQFELAFEARRTRWAYYVVSDAPSDGGALAIVDRRPNGNGSSGGSNDEPPLTFRATALAGEPAGSDAVADALRDQFPACERTRFVSERLVSCRQRHPSRLELRRGEHALIDALPHPSPEKPASTLFVTASPPAAPPSEAASEPWLFRVIQYLQPPSPNL